jgi:thymidine phosphorylase
MKREDQARELAATMVRLGHDHGVRTVAVLSGMDTPLGFAAGNALEVTESVQVLEGGGPTDVVELTLALATEMLALAGITGADPAARLADGSAMRAYRAMIAAQGGDPDAPMPTASIVRTVTAERDGVVHRLDAFAVGVAAWRLGAGRARKEDAVSATAGVLLRAKPGDAVGRGEPILELHTEDESSIPRALAALDGAISIFDDAYALPPLVIDRVTA